MAVSNSTVRLSKLLVAIVLPSMSNHACSLLTLKTLEATYPSCCHSSLVDFWPFTRKVCIGAQKSSSIRKVFKSLKLPTFEQTCNSYSQLTITNSLIQMLSSPRNFDIAESSGNRARRSGSAHRFAKRPEQLSTAGYTSPRMYPVTEIASFSKFGSNLTCHCNIPAHSKFQERSFSRN